MSLMINLRTSRKECTSFIRFHSNIFSSKEDCHRSHVRVILSCMSRESWRPALSSHSNPCGFDKTVCLVFNSTVLTTLDPAFERGGRVEWGRTDFFESKSVEKTNQTTRDGRVFYQNFGTVYQNYGTVYQNFGTEGFEVG